MKGWLSWYKDIIKKQNTKKEKESSNQQPNKQRESKNKKLPITESEDMKVFESSSDYKEKTYTNRITGDCFSIAFFSTLSEAKIIEDFILPPLLSEGFNDLEDLYHILPVPDLVVTEDMSAREEKLFRGYVEIRIKGNDRRACYVGASKSIGRNVTTPEVEYSVIGPKEGFVESIDQNLNLLRKRLPIKELVVRELIVGTRSRTRVAVIYIKGLADDENVNTVIQRLEDLDYDNIPDSSFVEQIITDQHNSPFPTALDTERPDRTASVLTEGKIAIITDGSPHALIAPTTLVEFFNSFDDYLTNWILASFFRVIRLFSVAFSLLITPIYVAGLTYHYELIPGDLLSTLISSRQLIPLPPFLEAVFLELVIELLREAGARLPSKVGQTIGIVGGIVIGTASVEAGLTSNVLLIIVALAALASFTTPVYKVGNAIRVLRFPFLFFAELWGLFGIVFCFCIIMTYTINLTSLGRPFLEPLYPPRFTDFRDAIIRLPFRSQNKRPIYTRPYEPIRFKPKEKEKKQKKKQKKKDIDEF